MSRKLSLLLLAASVTLLSAAKGAPKASTPPPARTTPAQQRVNEASCKHAVQAFYDWYLPRLMREVRTPAMVQALNAKGSYFSPELRKALAADHEAAKKSPDEIVGLDFDPFTNSQDPAARYVVRKATRTAKGHRVEVHAVVDGKPGETPDVVPELVLSRGHWVFVNFHYPAEGDEPPTDLLRVLRELREGRRHPAKRPGV